MRKTLYLWLLLLAIGCAGMARAATDETTVAGYLKASELADGQHIMLEIIDRNYYGRFVSIAETKAAQYYYRTHHIFTVEKVADLTDVTEGDSPISFRLKRYSDGKYIAPPTAATNNENTKIALTESAESAATIRAVAIDASATSQSNALHYLNTGTNGTDCNANYTNTAYQVRFVAQVNNAADGANTYLNCGQNEEQAVWKTGPGCFSAFYVASEKAENALALAPELEKWTTETEVMGKYDATLSATESAYNTVKDMAEGISTTAYSATDISTALSTLQALEVKSNYKLLYRGRLYYIRNNLYYFDDKGWLEVLYTAHSQSGFAWKQYEQNALAHYWTVEPVSGSDAYVFKIKSAEKQQYIAGAGTFSDMGGDVTLSPLTAYEHTAVTDRDCYNLSVGSNAALNAAGHENGARDTGTIITYGNANADKASSWSFVLATLDDVKAIAAALRTKADALLTQYADLHSGGLGEVTETAYAALQTANAACADDALTLDNAETLLHGLDAAIEGLTIGQGKGVYTITQNTTAVTEAASGEAVTTAALNTADARQLWVVNTCSATITDGEYTVTNLYTGNAIRLGTADGGTLTVAVAADGYTLTQGDVTLALTDDASTTWTLTYLGLDSEMPSTDIFAAYLNAPATAAAMETSIQAYQTYIGTGYNRYNGTSIEDTKKALTDGLSAWRTKYAAWNLAALQAMNGAADVTDGLTQLLDDITINQPADGVLLRIKNVGTDNYYRGVAGTTTSSFTATVDNTTTVFYWKDGKLVSYNNGGYLEGSFGEYSNTASRLVSFVAAGTGDLGQYNVCIGAGKNDASKKRFLYCDGTTTKAGDITADAVTTDSRTGYRFTLEAVDAIDVTISAARYATLYSPVRLKVPDGVTAYTGIVNDAGDALMLTTVDGGYLEAGTPVVLQGEAGTYTFPVVHTDGTVVTTEAPYTTDDNANSYTTATGALYLDGVTVNTSVADVANGGKVYTLQQPDDEDVGFYYYANVDATETAAAEESAEPTYNTTGLLIPAFKSFLHGSAATSVRAFVFIDGTVTALSSIPTAADAADAVYDLGGRRVAQPSRGLYIVKGKKIYVR